MKPAALPILLAGSLLLAPCVWAASIVPRTLEWNLTTRLMLS